MVNWGNFFLLNLILCQALMEHSDLSAVDLQQATWYLG